MMKNMSFSDAFAKQIKEALEHFERLIIPGDQKTIEYLENNVIIVPPGQEK